MMINEMRFRQILREEARRVLAEQVLAGVSTQSIASWTSSQAKKKAAGTATGLGSVTPYATAEGGGFVITGATLGAYLLASYGISKIVELFDETLRTIEAAKEAADRNTKQALSIAQGEMFLAGIESGKRQGLFTSPQLAAFFESSRKAGLNQRLGKEDLVNMGVVYSLLTSAEIDQAFQRAAESVKTDDSGKYDIGGRATRAIFGDGVDRKVYDRVITEFKSKLAALQESVTDQIVSLKMDKLMKQLSADAAKIRQDPDWIAQQKAKQGAYDAKQDAAMFKAGMVPPSYKPVPTGTAGAQGAKANTSAKKTES